MVNHSEWFNSHSNALNRYEINRYYQDLLTNIVSNLNNTNLNLEIGSGSGLTQKLFNNLNFISSDIVYVNNNIDVAFDMYAVPFLNNQFDFIFGVDLIHHLNDPRKAFTEISRILKPGGRLILIEPYVSFFSFFVYKIFHHENTSWRMRENELKQKIGNRPEDADNSLFTSMLFSKNWSEFREFFNVSFQVESIIFRDFLSLFATGGLQRKKSLIRNKGFDFLLSLEKKFSQKLLKYLGSRVILTVIKL